MILTIPDVIDASEHAALLELANTAPWVDGRETAGAALAQTKQNQQVSRESAVLADVARIVGAALQRNATFTGAAVPRHMHSLRLARYATGMKYGPHVDSPIMSDGGIPARADLSFTLFLGDPGDYDGGELALDTGAGELRFKLPARCIVVYATGQLHQVLPVTRGERLVVVGWVHSFVRNADDRATLFDLAQATELVLAAEGKSRAWDLLVKSRANLLRRWAE